MSEFIGHFHVVLIHLPIGILNSCQKMFPKTLLDSGGYNVPLFPDDTVF
ncbi:MAG: hypothetical protein ABJB05_04070 [Parafilimonas sp.]